MANCASVTSSKSGVAEMALAYQDHRRSHDALDAAVTLSEFRILHSPTQTSWGACRSIAAATMSIPPADLSEAAIVLGIAASWLDSIITASVDDYSDPVTAGIARAVDNVAKLLLDEHPAANSTQPIARLIEDLRREADCLGRAAS